MSLLPEDIVYRIFLDLFAVTERPHRGTCLLTFTLTCRRWRAIALSIPNLWSDLGSHWIPLTTPILQRSGALPLSIEYSARNNDLFRDRTFGNVCGAASRVSSLKLYLTTTGEMTAALDRLDKAGPLSSLKVLDLSVDAIMGYGFVHLPTSLLSNCKQLETFVLNFITFDWTLGNSAAPTPAHSVQSLTLTQTTSNDICYYASIGLIAILPSLVTLQCSWAVGGSIAPRELEPVPLSSLKNLTLTNWSAMRMHSYDLPQRLSLPNECIINCVLDPCAEETDMINALSSLFPGQPTDISVVAALFDQAAGSLCAVITMSETCPVKTVNFVQHDKTVTDTNANTYFEGSAFPALMRPCHSLDSLALSGQAITAVLSMLLHDAEDPSFPWADQPNILPTLQRVEIYSDCGYSVLLLLWEMLEARQRHCGLVLNELVISSISSSRDQQPYDLLAKIAKLVDRVVFEDDSALTI